MELSLVIPAFNEEQWIGKTLDSVLRNAPDAFKEIIVVDNASTDRTAEIARSYAGVRVVREERKGTGFARERGFQEARGDVVAFIDADTRMRAGWAGKVRRAFADPKVACVSGPYWYYDLGFPASAVIVLCTWYLAYPVFLFIDTFVIGGNFAIRRAVLERMNGFNTAIEFHGDDVDVGRRAGAFGKVVPLPTLILDSSARRLKARGVVRMLVIYAVNGLRGSLMRHPSYTRGYEEIR